MKLEPDKPDDILEGTTRKVFKFVYRQRNPVGIHEIQRGLGLSSPSLVYYHIAKLTRVGLVKEVDTGYVVEKTVFEGMIRIRRTAFPIQTAYVTFFITALVSLVFVLRPPQLTALFVFSLVAASVGSCVSLLEAYRTARDPY